MITQLLAATTSTGEAVQFWLLGTVAVLGGLGTVLMRRAVHSALCLAGTMVILALFYLANGAYFLGVVQIVVYTGAVMMLFLFVLMLVGVSHADSLKETLKGQRWLAVICGLGLGILLIAGIGQATLGSFVGLGEANAAGNVPGIATLLFTEYVVAFEATGVLLTISAVGATLLTHRERIERAKSQREQAEERVRSGKYLPPLPAPGVYARYNAVDRPGLLPDGTPSELSVSPTLRARGQVREISAQALAELAALEQRTAKWYGQLGPGESGPARGGRPGSEHNGSRNGRPGAGNAGHGPREGTGGIGPREGTGSGGPREGTGSGGSGSRDEGGQGTGPREGNAGTGPREGNSGTGSRQYNAGAGSHGGHGGSEGGQGRPGAGRRDQPPPGGALPGDDPRTPANPARNHSEEAGR